MAESLVKLMKKEMSELVKQVIADAKRVAQSTHLRFVTPQVILYAAPTRTQSETACAILKHCYGSIVKLETLTGCCSIKHPLVNNSNQSRSWITQTCALVGPRPVDLKLHYIQYRSDLERRREIMDLLRIPRKDKMEIHTLFDTLTNVYIPEGCAFMMDLPTNDYVAPLRGSFLIAHIEMGTPLNRGDISDTIDLFREIQSDHMEESKQHHASAMIQYINEIDQTS